MMFTKEIPMTRLEKGSVFPAFRFDTEKEENLLSTDVIDRKTVFWVLRYIGCTVCRYDIHLIAQKYEEFTAKNAQVYVVMQSDRTHVQNNLNSTGTVLPFSVICDPKMKIYDLLDIQPASSMDDLVKDRREDLQKKAASARETGFTHGDYEGNEQQLPALFIVNEKGIVEYVRYAENIMDMPSVNEVISLL